MEEGRPFRLEEGSGPAFQPSGLIASQLFSPQKTNSTYSTIDDLTI
jgi:hypothetical protein